MIEYWHNPRCSKSRQGLALLRERGAELRVRRYLDDPPNRAELATALAALGVTAVEMMRSGDKLFRDLGLHHDADEATLIAAMAAHPILIERPLAISDRGAVIGRPPDRLLDLV